MIETPGLEFGAEAETGAGTEALIKEARRRQRRRHVLAGAAAVLALAGAAGVLAAWHGPGGRAPGPGRAGFRILPGDAPVSYIHPPAYYAYAVQGSIYGYFSHGTQYGMSVPRYVKLRATATGKLLATVSPPKPYNEVGALTADANGRTFAVAAQRVWERNAGPSPRLMARDRNTPLKLLLLHITPSGHLERAWLSFPQRMTPAQQPTVALSPDGTRLAVAFGGRGRAAVIQVISLRSGRLRQWTLPHSRWTPALSGAGAWAGNGRTLAFRQEFLPSPGQLRQLGQRSTPRTGVTRVGLLDTTAPGTSLAASPVLVLHAPAGTRPGEPFLTPDGTTLITPVEAAPSAEPARNPWRGELAVYSAGTGALLRTRAPWVWRWPSPPGRGGYPAQAIARSSPSGNRLVLLQPRADLNVLGSLTGTTFGQAGHRNLPGSARAYQELQYALRHGPMAW